jgi:hypothetical protein
MITINTPYIVNGEFSTKICCDILFDDRTGTAWYEVEKDYGEYLVSERCDSFLVAALPWALKNGESILINSAISEKLYFQIKNLLLPTVIERVDIYKKIDLIRIEKPYVDITCGNAIGMGISCGVDSLYTYFKMNNICSKFNLSHLTYFNVGSHRDEYHGEKARKLFQKRIVNARQFAEEENKAFVTVDSNIGDIFPIEHIYSHAYRSVSAVMALQKLFHVYYYSAGYEFNEFDIKEYDPAAWQIFLLPLLSTEELTFYSIGEEASRLEKIEFFSHHHRARMHLDVCQAQYPNCTICEKCRRTICELWALDKLELYADAFDLKLVKKNEKEQQILVLNSPFTIYGVFIVIISLTTSFQI